MSKAKLLRYHGQLYEIEDSPFEVTSAIIAPDHIAIDWIEGGDLGGLTASCVDGAYEGTVTYPDYPGEQWNVRLGLYQAASGAILLFGDWSTPDGTERGTYLFQLVPDTK